jgi:uncharacterized protein (TIGR00369 family)
LLASGPLGHDRRAALAPPEVPMTSPLPRGWTAEQWNERSRGHYPELIGMTITDIGPGHAEGRLEVGRQLFAPNGFLHAATVVGLADTLCGCGCAESLPETAIGFTTIELKANFLGTATEGVILGKARMIHGGRTTQVWDADITSEATGKPIASFRCTQMVLYPR